MKSGGGEKAAVCRNYCVHWEYVRCEYANEWVEACE